MRITFVISNILIASGNALFRAILYVFLLPLVFLKATLGSLSSLLTLWCATCQWLARWAVSFPRPTVFFMDILYTFSCLICFVEGIFWESETHLLQNCPSPDSRSDLLILAIFSRKWNHPILGFLKDRCTTFCREVSLPHASHSSLPVLENQTDNVKPVVFLRRRSPVRFSCCLWIGFY